MTSIYDIIRRIELMLGPEGSAGLADAVTSVLAARELLPWDPVDGYSLAILWSKDFNDDGATWNQILAEAEELHAKRPKAINCPHCDAPLTAHEIEMLHAKSCEDVYKSLSENEREIYDDAVLKLGLPSNEEDDKEDSNDD